MQQLVDWSHSSTDGSSTLKPEEKEKKFRRKIVKKCCQGAWKKKTNLVISLTLTIKWSLQQVSLFYYLRQKQGFFCLKKKNISRDKEILRQYWLFSRTSPNRLDKKKIEGETEYSDGRLRNLVWRHFFLSLSFLQQL